MLKLCMTTHFTKKLYQQCFYTKNVYFRYLLSRKNLVGNSTVARRHFKNSSIVMNDRINIPLMNPKPDEDLLKEPSAHLFSFDNQENKDNSESIFVNYEKKMRPIEKETHSLLKSDVNPNMNFSKTYNWARMHINKNEIVIFAHLIRGDLENAIKTCIKTRRINSLSPALILALIVESKLAEFSADKGCIVITRNYPFGDDLLLMANLISYQIFIKQNRTLPEYYQDFDPGTIAKHLLENYKYWDSMLPVHLESFKQLIDDHNLLLETYVDCRLTKIENLSLLAKQLYDPDVIRQMDKPLYNNNIPYENIDFSEEILSITDNRSTYERFTSIHIPDYLQKSKTTEEDDIKFTNLTNQWKSMLSDCLRDIHASKISTTPGEDLTLTKVDKDKNVVGFSLFFDKSECDRLATMIINNILYDGLLSTYGVSVSTLIFRIGHMFARIFREKFSFKFGCTKFISDVTKEYYRTMGNESEDICVSQQLPREKWLSIALKKYGVLPCLPLVISTNEIKLSTTDHIARFILNNFRDHQGNLAFSPVMRSGADQSQIIVFSANKKLEKLYENVYCTKLELPTHKLPRLAPVVPYIDFTLGNSVHVRKGLVLNTMQPHIRLEHSQRCLNHSMAPALDTVTTLGSIAWTVNLNHLDVVIKHIEKNKDYTDMDIISECAPISMREAFNYCGGHGSISKVSTFNEKFKQAYRYRQDKFKEYNDWLNFFKIISICEYFRGKTFYIPHLLDFRGRAYPDCVFLNHYGSDIIRSMLMFSKKKRVGERGLYWLKLHLFNQLGVNKDKTIDERIQFVDENLDNVMASVEDPINNTWWHKSKKKWQALATCFEIKGALEDPNYESGFPIHQDGSCNGLQHFAALGRNPHGARSVNLEPNDRPNDVYADVAMLVKERCKNVPKMAKLLQNGDVIDRDVVKTTVMTFVYGVTYMGAIAQVEKKLSAKQILSSDEVHLCSVYISKEIFIALETLFGSAVKIMEWLSNIGYEIASDGRPVTWDTPLNFSVNQYYVNKTVGKYDLYPIPTQDCRKHRAAMSPNFIHSLDAAHMMLTCIDSQRHGIAFASVHDSFWTHPSDVDTLNHIIRKQFVRLHNSEIFEVFLNSVMKNSNIDRFPKYLQTIPFKDEFDINKVMESPFFFS